jgi:hypothetical protein
LGQISLAPNAAKTSAPKEGVLILKRRHGLLRRRGAATPLTALQDQKASLSWAVSHFMAYSPWKTVFLVARHDHQYEMMIKRSLCVAPTALQALKRNIHRENR